MKNRKIVLRIALILTIFMPLTCVLAGVTDNETNNSQIIRKTTTNYFTTIVFNGSFKNEVTGETDTFTKTTEEFNGNVDSETVINEVNKLKQEFTNWANNKGKGIITYGEDEINYYYNVHDEITQSSSDVILVGDINDFQNAYNNQGTVTIETILDKHITLTITANAIIKEIKNVNIDLTAPSVGNKVLPEGYVGEDTENIIDDGTMEPDNKPVATTNTIGVEVDDAYWITGTYMSNPENWDSLFFGTFKQNEYYYADITISSQDGYALSNNTMIKVNGEAPAEVFAIYGNSSTRFIAKIKAQNVEYKYLETKGRYVINKDNEARFRIDADYTLFANGGKVYVDNNLVDEANYTSELGSTIITFVKAFMDNLNKGSHTLKVVFNNGNTATTNFTITNPTTNPQTGDNIYISVIIMIISIIGLTEIYLKKKYQ